LPISDDRSLSRVQKAVSEFVYLHVGNGLSGIFLSINIAKLAPIQKHLCAFRTI
jgi:hypothetical protein